MSRTRTDCEGSTAATSCRSARPGCSGLTLPDAAPGRGPPAPRPQAEGRRPGSSWSGSRGGPATIDMWDLKPDAPEDIRGEFKPIATAAPGVAICEHLPKLAKVMDSCALVRSLDHTIPAHGPGTVFMTTGNKPTAALQYPALGSLAARLLPPSGACRRTSPSPSCATAPPGAGAGYLGPAYNPFVVEGEPGPGTPSGRTGCRCRGGFTPARPGGPRRRCGDRFDRGLQALDVDRGAGGPRPLPPAGAGHPAVGPDRKAFDLAREPDALRDAYGRTPFGQGALAARRLVEAGVRFVTLGLGGWDTHGDNFRRPARPPAAAAGPGPRGPDRATWTTAACWTRRSSCCAGEFGRTPRINSTAGRDHWARSMAVLLAGGGFRGGAVHGTTDARGMAPARTPARRTTWPRRSSAGWGSAPATRSVPRRPADPDLPRGAPPGAPGGLSGCRRAVRLVF